ncbi:hypothetical protein NHF46_23215 [Arthrobacter alpinus]|uniref:Uncharacterized protein n=1 Tax=Arthrobacter alpinus TaxID=656366 RepID=A0A0S2LVC2_9MICC|nr:hypothetical protein [Arthrobacter alpinus]ALO65413.1 hypothetical protein AS189_01505 [Arthrobacter alpinus]MDD0859812.1 hypothetical protein [Arthrobacter alpinus]
MTTTGAVRIWHDEEGWGVLDSESTPGGWEAAAQDGYSFRAIRAWPAGDDYQNSAPAAGG